MRERKPITTEGAFRLAREILLDAYRSYVSSLKLIMKNRKEAEKIERKVRKYDNQLTKTKPTDEELIKLYNYYEVVQEKSSIELFYNSRLYEIITLGKGIPGNEIIERIQKKVGYKE